MPDYSMYSPAQLQTLPRLGDLYMAVKQDMSLGADRQNIVALLQQLIQQFGSQASLSSLAMQGLGGILGALVARYFGMGLIGQTVGAVTGLGLMSRLNQPKDKAPMGYKTIGM